MRISQNNFVDNLLTVQFNVAMLNIRIRIAFGHSGYNIQNLPEFREILFDFVRSYGFMKFVDENLMIMVILAY